MPKYKIKHLGSRIWTLFSQLVAMFREVVEFLQGGVWYSFSSELKDYLLKAKSGAPKFLKHTRLRKHRKLQN